MEDNYPPKVLIDTWLELIKSDNITPIRRNLIEQNVERIFGSLELAEMYKDNIED
jgi:hypothetical protein